MPSGEPARSEPAESAEPTASAQAQARAKAQAKAWVKAWAKAQANAGVDTDASQPCAVPDSWDWPHDVEQFPADAPLQALMLTATRLMGAYGQCTVAAAGLKVSLAGLGVLRVLLAADGLKSSEVADRGWSSPGTVTAVVNTLVRDGFVERRPDETDRRVVRLYITEQGRAVVTYYVTQAAPKWRKALDFVDKDTEAVVRQFFVQMISHLGQLVREERRR